MSDERTSGSDHSGSDLSEILGELLTGAGKQDYLGKLERLLRAASAALQGAEPAKADIADAGAAKGKGLLETVGLILSTALDNPEALSRQVAAFTVTVLDILRQDCDLAPDPADRRFRDDLWHDSAVLRGLMQIYLAWGRHMQAWIDAQELDEDDRRRIRFIVDQVLAAFSPSNLPLNPAALKRAEKSEGMSTVAGIKNFLQDIKSNRGMPRQINPNAYRLGVDLATTPGSVVHRNDQLELIQYRPQTAKVRSRPLLLIPPQINKYYAFDLKPKNSILGFLVRQGFQVFVLSWKNPGRDVPHWGLDDYLRSVIDGIEVIGAITRSGSVNLISACAGGLTAMALLGYLAEIGRPLVESHSLLVTALLPDSGSVLELFTTSGSLELARRISRQEGAMDGKDLAHVFAWLRPQDLIWTYWVNNNIMGRQPPPLDVLYWDNDPTRVPAALHSDFIDMYQLDVFRKPHRLSLLGRPIDFSKTRVDTYFVAGRDDYLVPWRGIYHAARLFGGQHRFVMSTSGHVQSILRPPNLANTVHFTNRDFPDAADDWFANADQVAGTWWFDWVDWLTTQSGPLHPAPDAVGTRAFPPIADAPGTYVLERMHEF